MLQKNLYKFNIYEIFDSFSVFWVSIVAIFYLFLGFSLTQIGILSAITFAVIFTLEIPTGILGDKLDRKTVMIIASLFNLATAILLFISTSFIGVFAAAACLGISRTLKSGTNIALMYDTHKAIKREKDFKKFRSKNIAISMYSRAIAVVIGGVLAGISFKLVFGLAIVSSAIHFLIVLSFKEPRVFTKKKTPHLGHLIPSFGEIIKTRKVLVTFLYGIIITGIVEGLVRFHQIFTKEIGFTTSHVGFLFGLIFLFAGFSSHLSSKIDKKISIKKSIILIPFSLSLLYILLGSVNLYFIGWFIVIEAIVYGYFMPFIDQLRNQYLSSERRATILSISGFAVSVYIMIISLLIGFFSDIFGIDRIYFGLGISLLVITMPLAISLRNQLRQ